MPKNNLPKKIEPRLLKGFRDYVGDDALVFSELINKVSAVFEKFGFMPMETPVLEYADILLGKYGKEGDKLMYRFVDQGNREVAMRYDHTVPLARMLAVNQNLPLPFKRYVLAPVWRADKPQKGRLREFYQCDADIVGSDQTRADAEIVALVYELLSSLGVKKFAIQINHRGLLDALVQQVNVSKTQVAGVFHAIDKFPKYGESNFRKDCSALGLSSDQINSLIELINFSGTPKSALKKIKDWLSGNDQGLQALQELSAIFEHAEYLGVPEKNLLLDVKIVRGLDYYTGLVMETVLGDLPMFGSVIGGGRYDRLIGTFMGREVPAVGVSLGLGRLFDAMHELKLLPEPKNPAQVLCGFMDPEGAYLAEQMARDLRAAGINSAVYLERAAKLDKQLKYADKLNIPFVVWQGPDERKKKVVAIKDLKKRQQKNIGIKSLIKTIVKLSTQ